MCLPRLFAFFRLPVPGWLLFLFLLARAITGQAQVPPGGYVPRPVKHLARVPEPPGGLVPYRKGRLWGYSDTTGRLVVKPVFEREPWPFALGIGMLAAESASNGLVIINARGEVLRTTASRAIGFAPDGHLKLIPRRGVGFRPSLAGLHYPKGQREAVLDTTWLAPRHHDDNRLSATRGLRYRSSSLPGKFLALNPEYERAALIDEHGHRLTAYTYATIEPFQAGFAVARRTGTRGFVLLNRQGREVIQPRAFLDRLCNNRALAASQQVRGQTELVDSTGRIIRSFTSHKVRWLIAGELLVAPSQPGRVGLYDRDGRALLNGREFADVGHFWNRRLWVRTPEGLEGLLDSHLRWVVPAEYDALYYSMSGGDREHSLPRYKIDLFFYDTAYMVVRQHGRYGQVAVASGRLAIPTRYDTVLTPLTQGFATMQREGRPYVVATTGLELTSGNADGLLATCREGACRIGVMQNKQAALFDDAGQQLCPWQKVSPLPYAEVRYYLPYYGYRGLVIVFNAPPIINGRVIDAERRATLINRAGQPQLPWRYEDIGAWDGFYALRWPQASGLTKWDLYDSQLHSLLPRPVDLLTRLPGGWITTGKELFHDGQGRIVVPDAAKHRFVTHTYFLPDEPFATGIWRVEWYEPNQRFNRYAGYLTIHGRPLWVD